MFERFKNLIHGLKEDGMYTIAICTMMYSLFAWALLLSIKADPRNEQFVELLGYSLWTTDAFHYLFFRFWNYIPFVVFTVSVTGIAKTFITGKCSILKGLCFGDVIFVNTITASLFLAPFAIEGALCLAAIVSIFLSFFALCGVIVKICSKAIIRFDSACVVEQKEETSH